MVANIDSEEEKNISINLWLSFIAFFPFSLYYYYGKNK